MEQKERELIFQTHDSVVRILEVLEGDSGVCERVKENSKKIVEHDNWIRRKDERGATLTWLFSLVGGSGTLGFILKLLKVI